MMHEMKTVNGYDFFEVSSALQKSIRQGLEDEAIFWTVELCLSKYHEYAWKRIKIISSEDIGIAEPNITTEILALYENYTTLAKKKDEHAPERLFIIHAVVMLCRANKSRLIDWLTVYAFGCHSNRLRPIPDFALDKHTKRGKKLGRGWNHFFEEGCRLSPHLIQVGEAEAEENAKGALMGTCGGGLFDEK